ncbi:MAG: nitroreductase [Thermoplasmata archaeon]|nr:MAG: nitroreductase [Thermoplasmata archaeon]
MDVEEAIRIRRSIRRFKQKPVPVEMLEKLVDAARVAPSGANLQPLEYIVVTDASLCDRVFEGLKWAGYLKPEWRPPEDEKPSAYIVVLADKQKSPYYEVDIGLAAENIMLLAVEYGLGCCVLRNIDKDEIRSLFSVPDYLYIDSVIAVGYPAEKPVVEELRESVEYWRDEQGTLHVPKRKLKDILHINRY